MSLGHLDIVKRLCDNNCNTFTVGGAIRDMMMGLDPHDFDVVTEATPDQIEHLFRDCSVKSVGKSFGVILVNGFEVATFRHDRHSGIGDENCIVEFAESIKEDLCRRDFTVNAMAFCELSGQLVDEHGGEEDLKNRVIRFVGDANERIKEDPNRIVRACRFKAKLNGTFSDSTLVALKEHAHFVRDHVAPERIRMEILKAMELPNPSLFFENLHEIGVLQFIFPSLEACFGHEHGKWQAEDVFEHCMIVGDAISANHPVVRLAGFLHDVGKPITWKDGKFIFHEKDAVPILHRELKALVFTNEERAEITSLVACHMFSLTGAKPKTVRKLLKKLSDHNITPEAFLRVRIADRRGNLTKERFTLDDIRTMRAMLNQTLAEDLPMKVTDLAVSGGDLIKEFNLTPGAVVGQLQKFLLAHVLEEGFEENTPERLVLVARESGLLEDTE